MKLFSTLTGLALLLGIFAVPSDALAASHRDPFTVDPDVTDSYNPYSPRRIFTRRPMTGYGRPIFTRMEGHMRRFHTNRRPSARSIQANRYNSDRVRRVERSEDYEAVTQSIDRRAGRSKHFRRGTRISPREIRRRGEVDTVE